MKASIRLKLLAIIFLACALPLALGVASLGFFGYRSYASNKGRLYQSAAAQLAQNIDITTNAQIEKLSDWIALSGLENQIRDQPVMPQFDSRLPQETERQWKSLRPNQFPLQPILQNDMARRLRAFQKINPLFKEIFITDARGLVIASTGKTSDYIQSDEAWWQKSKSSPPRVAWLQGIFFDQSAGVHSLDIAFCLHNPQTNQFQGVIKAVLNASALFAGVPYDAGDNGAVREVVLSDGRILTRFFDDSYVPLSARHDELTLPQAEGGSWLIAPMKSAGNNNANPSSLIGFAPLRLEGASVERVAVEGLNPMMVLVHEDASQVLAPIRNQLWILGAAGGVLLLGLSLIALIIADRKIIRPLHLLGRAARGVARTARMEENIAPNEAAQTAAREAVQRCREISTGDEIETLADDFALMGERVLRYHEHLEKEIAAKTGEIQRDLQMAREFQESLLPTDYPKLSDGDDASPGQSPRLRLDFHHVYQPAQTMGGDFFDVFKLSDQQAGIFIADVMGHGARSALITAILRTLLQDLSAKSNDPANLMQLVNRHFFEIMQGSRQFVFVSAFCLVIDVHTGVATYANAGHPSPLIAQAATGQVLPLLGHTSNSREENQHANAALGLSRDTTYYCHSRPVDAGEAFLLFTDGISEAPAPDGEEFGTARLQNVIAQELQRAQNSPTNQSKLDVAALSGAAMSAIRNWMQGAPSPDDICLVVVGTEAAPSPARIEAGQ